MENPQKRGEKRNIFFVCGAISLIIILFAITVVLLYPLMWSQRNITPAKPDVGTSEGYLKAALHYHMCVNTRVDPCDDFYEYVCGNYVVNNEIPSHMNVYSNFYRLIEEADEKMKVLLESPEKSTSSGINKMKTVYRACLREEDYVPKAPQAMREILKKIGPWPMLDGKSKIMLEGDFNLQKLLEKVVNGLLLTPDQVPLFNLQLFRNPENHTERILYFDQATLLLASDCFREPVKFDKELRAIVKLGVDQVSQFARDIGLKEISNLTAEFEEILKLETDLANIMKRENYNRLENSTTKMRKFSEFNEEFKQLMNFDLKQFALVTNLPTSHSVINSEAVKVLVFNMEYHTGLADIIRKTNPKTLMNYIMYKTFLHFETFMGPKYRDMQFEYDKEINEMKEAKPFWKNCIREANEMERAYGALYARHHFDLESKTIMNTMISNLQDSLTEIIQETTWMTEITKSKAHQKIAEMTALVGFSELAFNDTKLDAHCETFNISDAENFMTIRRSLRKWLREKEIEAYVKPVNRNDFSTTSADVNAYHDYSVNAILFPAGILQFPLFYKNQPQSINYGAIGSIIGHEITHGFDKTGKDFDEQGNLQYWWSEESEKNFDKRAQCMIEQYSAIEVANTGGMHIDGTSTASENIADNGGLRESYRAYKKYLSQSGPEPILPGIDITSEQLFFYGFANAWCESTYMKQRLLTDSHSPNKFMCVANLVLQNNDDFARVFSCPLGSPMNPDHKCQVW